MEDQSEAIETEPSNTTNSDALPNAFELLNSREPRRLPLKPAASNNLHITMFNDVAEYFQRNGGIVKRGYV